MYKRQLVNAGILEKADDVSTIQTATVSEALGGVEINECANVGAVTSAVAEGSNEVGTDVYKRQGKDSTEYCLLSGIHGSEYPRKDLTGWS